MSDFFQKLEEYIKPSKTTTHIYRPASILIRKPLLHEFTKRRLLEDSMLEVFYTNGVSNGKGVDTTTIKEVKAKYISKKTLEYNNRLKYLNEFVKKGIVTPIVRNLHTVESGNETYDDGGIYDNYWNGLYITTNYTILNSFYQGKTKFNTTQTAELSNLALEDVIDVLVDNRADDASTARVTIKNEDDKYSFTEVDENGFSYNVGNCIIEPNDQILIFLPNKSGEVNLVFNGYINRVIKNNDGGFHSISLECECMYKMLRMTRTNLQPAVNAAESGGADLNVWSLPNSYYNKPIQSCMLLLAETYSNMYSQLPQSNVDLDNKLIRFLYSRLVNGTSNKAILEDLLSDYTNTVLYGLPNKETQYIKGIVLDYKKESEVNTNIENNTKAIDSLKKTISLKSSSRASKDLFLSTLESSVPSSVVQESNGTYKSSNSEYSNLTTDRGTSIFLGTQFFKRTPITLGTQSFNNDDQRKQLIIKTKSEIDSLDEELRSLNSKLNELENKKYERQDITVQKHIDEGGSVMFVAFKDLAKETEEEDFKSFRTIMMVNGRIPIGVFYGTNQLLYQKAATDLPLFNSTWSSNLDIIVNIAELLNFNVYSNHSVPCLHIGPPNFYLGEPQVTVTADTTTLVNTNQTSEYSFTNKVVKKDDERSAYKLLDSDIINIVDKKDDSFIFNWFPICGQFTDDMVKGEGFSQVNKIVVSLPNLVDSFGWRMKKEAVIPDVEDWVTLYLYGLGLLYKQNKEYNSASITIMGNSEIHVNNSIYLKDYKTVYYVESIIYKYVAGASFTMSLNCNYGRKSLFALDYILPNSKTKTTSNKSIQTFLDRKKVLSNIEKLNNLNQLNALTYNRYKYFLTNTKVSDLDITQFFSERSLDGYLYEEIPSQLYEECIRNIYVFQSDKSISTLWGQHKKIMETVKDVRKREACLSILYKANSIFKYVVPGSILYYLPKFLQNNTSKVESVSNNIYVLKYSNIYKQIKRWNDMDDSSYVIRNSNYISTNRFSLKLSTDLLYTLFLVLTDYGRSKYYNTTFNLYFGNPSFIESNMKGESFTTIYSIRKLFSSNKCYKTNVDFELNKQYLSALNTEGVVPYGKYYIKILRGDSDLVVASLENFFQSVYYSIYNATNDSLYKVLDSYGLKNKIAKLSDTDFISYFMNNSNIYYRVLNQINPNFTSKNVTELLSYVKSSAGGLSE